MLDTRVADKHPDAQNLLPSHGTPEIDRQSWQPNLADIAEICPKTGRYRPSLAEIRPGLIPIRLEFQIGRFHATFGRNRAGIDQKRPSLARISPELDQIRAKSENNKVVRPFCV